MTQLSKRKMIWASCSILFSYNEHAIYQEDKRVQTWTCFSQNWVSIESGEDWLVWYAAQDYLVDDASIWQIKELSFQFADTLRTRQSWTVQFKIIRRTKRPCSWLLIEFSPNPTLTYPRKSWLAGSSCRRRQWWRCSWGAGALYLTLWTPGTGMWQSTLNHEESVEISCHRRCWASLSKLLMNNLASKPTPN